MSLAQVLVLYSRTFLTAFFITALDVADSVIVLLYSKIILETKLYFMREKHNQTILLADDDIDDLELLCEVISEIDEDYEIFQVNNGKEALAKLTELQEAGNLPCLIVLDINMPKMDGKQTLAAIKSDPSLSTIPVVIFSTSNNEMDRLYFRKKKVEMITKPVEFQALFNVAEKMLSYCEE